MQVGDLHTIRCDTSLCILFRFIGGGLGGAGGAGGAGVLGGDWIICFHYVYKNSSYLIIIIIIIITIFINCNWVVTRWQWLFYMYTNMKKSN